MNPMLDVVGQRFVFAVAQEPFETAGADSGIYNQFCALLPIFDSNGESANLNDFPDFGDVWWMVRPGARGLAEPGRLVTGIVEDSIKKGQSGFAQYQVIADSVEPLRSRDYVEIIYIPATAISETRDLIGSAFRLTIDHVPIDSVYVRWRNELLGRFRTASERVGTSGQWEVRLRPESGDSTVLKVSKELLQKIPIANQLISDIEVSLESRPLHESIRLNQCHYHLVETEAFNEAVPEDVQRISIRTDEQVIQQLARRLLTRNKRQQLVAMLEELDEISSNSSELTVQEDRAVVSSLKTILTSDSKAIGELANSIVQTGLINDRIGVAIEERVEKHIAENAAKLQSDINKKVADIRVDLEKLSKERTQIQSELQNLRARKKKELDQELAKRREEVEKELKKQDESAKKQLAELKRQEKVLSNNLETVAAKLATNRDEVVNQFLTIAPLLNQFGLLPGAQPPTTVAYGDSVRPTVVTQSAERAQGSQQPPFVIPTFTGKADAATVPEEEFFERFKSHVENSGFRYREIDLLSFHVSVKCGELTILGGLPGTGKSSLSRLYSQAIRGDAASDDIDRFLHVAVSPSWLDMRDLIGHVNALNQTFQPAESGLFQQLVFAQEEFRQIGDESGLYFVCLDEMNLSHVEHYFSGLLQVLEQPDSHRRLRAFPENVVDLSSPFGAWSSILVPRSVRFIGTVNFDETTRQLSQRLLDRANMIRLPSNQLPPELEEASATKASGAPVRLRDYRGWIRNAETYGDLLATLIDDLRDDLSALSCPMNPRRISGMRKFLASWPEKIAPREKAVDLQFAQRVLTQIRGLFQPGARDAVVSIRRKLEQHSLEFAESLRVLDEIQHAELTDLFLGPDGKA
jgi:hypothetical protein